jgi:hypothetical protein
MMKKRIMADIRAALILIVTEDLNALRILLRNITTLTSKSIFMYRKS